MPEYEKSVLKAQQGDLPAFNTLVHSFGQMAHTVAASWLGDSQLAEDVVQEAFLDAYLRLAQVENPAAFPGWLRRIVIKHCDRQTRRMVLRIDHNADPDDGQANDSPLPQIINAEETGNLRRAIESLPEQVRLVVALHYLAGASGQAIADFLELPLSTVKKRLRVARDKLRKYEMSSLQKNLPKMDHLPNEVALFVAIRADHRDTIEQLLKADPTLANTKQNWGRDLVYQGVLPFSTRATPLIAAIEAGRLAIVTQLINHGADVNGTCGCETGEAPIWTACLLNRIDHAEVLLDAGANPNIKSAAGNTPLHVASMRGHEPLVRLLLKHGADKTAIDDASGPIWPLTAGAETKPGWTPLQWAENNGHTQVAALLGETSEMDSETSEAAEPEIATDQLLHTGIKALDFLAPIKKGSLIRVPFKAGVGMIVLMGELTQLFLSKENGAVVWTGFTQPPFEVADLEADMQEFGFRQSVEIYLESYQASDHQRQDRFEAGLRHIEALSQQGKDVLAIVQSADGFEAELEQNLLRLRADSLNDSVTTIVITPFRDEEQSWSELRAPYSTQLSLDRERAVRHLYPTFDPIRTQSVPHETINERHASLLAVVKQLYQSVGGIEEIMSGATDDHRCLQDLTAYFSQPFKVTEPFRGTPGESVPLDEVLTEIEQILRRSQPD